MLSGIKAKVSQPAFYFPVLCLNNRGMKRVLTFVAFLLLGQIMTAQQNRATRMLGYYPAPGQFINNALLGTPAAAVRITTADISQLSLVSLGSFGGSLVLGFEKPVYNDPSNPYGIDFSIFGNAFDGSSEPGVVWVMKDENGNGLPDDTWYELAGSASFHPQVRRQVRVTWTPLADGSISWSDGRLTVVRPKNSFHTQPYYPQPEFFPAYPRDAVTLTGTLLPLLPFEEYGLIKNATPGFGYADSHAWNRYGDLSDPDNPYTPEITEGAGGDPMDIAWAIDTTGKYVFLDRIDFVKIVTGVLAESPLLGEISPEIAAVVATTPSQKQGRDQMTVIHPHPGVLMMGDSLALYAAFFRQGQITGAGISFTGLGEGAGLITPDGHFRALRGGEFTLEARVEGETDASAQTRVVVRAPDSLWCRPQVSSLTCGETLTFTPVLTDQYGQEIIGTGWGATTVDPQMVAVTPAGEGFQVTALQPGTTLLTLTSSRFKGFSRSFPLTVKRAPDAVRVFATALTSTENLLPAQWMTITAHSVNDRVENRRGDYSQPSFISLAQAASAILTRAGVSFLFRDEDPASRGLYLYSAEKEGQFTYGWGGKKEPLAFARGWIFRKNHLHLINNLNLHNVADGDTLILYHEDNIQEEWRLPLLTSMPSEARKGDALQITVAEVTCSLTEEGAILEKELHPLGNQTVSFAEGAKSGAFTDQQGSVTVVVPSEPPLLLRSGVNAVLITPATATQAGFPSGGMMKLWPNPVVDGFRLRTGLSGEATVTLRDVSGRLLQVLTVAGPETWIPAGHLSPGIYLVEIRSGENLDQSKILKL